MKITVEMDDGQKVVIERDTSLLTNMVKRYPEVSMMRVNEELDELGKAITKGIINGKPKKLANIDEEIVDVLEHIMWAIARFNVTIPHLQEWEDEKGPRYVEREKKDLNIFRTEEARDAYWKHSFVPENTWGFQRTGDGHYNFIGIKDLAEAGTLANDFFTAMQKVRRESVDQGLLNLSVLHTPDIMVLQYIAGILNPATDALPSFHIGDMKGTDLIGPLKDAMNHQYAEITKKILSTKCSGEKIPDDLFDRSTLTAKIMEMLAIRRALKNPDDELWAWWVERLKAVPTTEAGGYVVDEYMKAVDEFKVKMDEKYPKPTESVIPIGTKPILEGGNSDGNIPE